MAFTSDFDSIQNAKHNKHHLVEKESEVMARAEKYNKGVSWRSRFLRSEKKRRKENDKPAVVLSEFDLLKRIGSGVDYSTERFYDWNMTLSNHMLSKEDEVLKVRSLKDLCAMKITDHHELITHELLKIGNWSIWEPVWRYIVRWRRDNFKTFQTFADTFHTNPGFTCHDDLKGIPSARRKTLLYNTAKDTKRHRVERLFSNIKLGNLITILSNSSFDNLTILEVSSGLQHLELLELTNLTNLTALKIAQKDELKDIVINSWCSALKSNKWTKLQILSLPRISESSVIKLQKQTRISRLLYIEINTGTSRFSTSKEWSSVDMTNWELVTDKAITEQPLALKLHGLLATSKVTNHSLVPSSSTIMLDLNIVDKEFVDYGGLVTQKEYDDLWNLGEVRGCYYGLLLRKVSKVDDMCKEMSKEVVKKVGTKRIKTGPKSKVISVNSFFDL